MKCSNTSKAHKRNPKLIYANCQDSKIMVQFSFRIWLHLVEFSSTALRLLREKHYLPAASNLSITSDNKWYDDCKERGHCRLNFLHQFTRHVKAYDSICLVYTKLHALSYGYKLSLFGGGPIALRGLVHFSIQLDPPLLK